MIDPLASYLDPEGGLSPACSTWARPAQSRRDGSVPRTSPHDTPWGMIALMRRGDEFDNVETHPLDPAAAPGAQLTIIAPNGTSRAVSLPPRGQLVIGRAPGCDIVVSERAISRRHATIFVHAGGVEIEDLASANGVRVGGRRLDAGERVLVSAGTAVELGDVLLVVHRHGGAIAEGAGAERTLPPTPPQEPRARSAQPSRIVADPAMERVYALVDRIADTPLNVLLVGETGAGKEVVAEALHAASSRANGPLVRVNCAALSPQLLESELFGHEKGAFTGAMNAKPGLVEAADGGTLFLDEVGELPLEIQVKLLRMLESRELLRVGSLRPRAVDVRFVAATHRDLRREIEARTFREDLFHRLNGVMIAIPPLRARPAELAPLARAFAQEAARRVGRPAPALSGATLAVLGRYAWPGNVRELRNAIERAVALAGRGAIEPEHLPEDVVAQGPVAGSQSPPVAVGAPPIADASAQGRSPRSLRNELADLERQRIVDALARAGGNQTRAAELLGIPRRTLVKRLREYRIPRPRK